VTYFQRLIYTDLKCWPGSSVGIATELWAGQSGIESQWGRDSPSVQTSPGAHPASCKMGTGSFPWVKRGRGRAADHSSPSSAAVMEEYSYTPTHLLGHTGSVTGSLYLFLLSLNATEGCWAVSTISHIIDAYITCVHKHILYVIYKPLYRFSFSVPYKGLSLGCSVLIPSSQQFDKKKNQFAFE